MNEQLERTNIMAKITFEGNLGSTPVTSEATNGKDFIRVSIAEKRSYLNKETDTWVDAGTDWHTVFVFSPHVQAHLLNLKKGARVSIEGTLSYRVDGKTEDGHDTLNMSIIANRIESAPLAKKVS